MEYDPQKKLAITLMLTTIIVISSYLLPDDNLAFIALVMLALVTLLSKKSSIRMDNALISWGIYYLFCIFSLIASITIGLASIQQMRSAQFRYGENRNESNKSLLL